MIISTTDITNKRRKMTFINFIRMSVVIIFLVFICWGLIFLSNYVGEPTKVTVQTNAFEQPREILLSDGSKIYLNTNSKITYDEEFKAEKREASLQGEAFFEVNRNPEKPFYIYADQSIIKVLGTSFNINTNKKRNRVLITVLNGKVEFTSKTFKTSAVLSHDEMAILNTINGRIEKQENNDQNAISWLTGKFIFTDTPLEEVCKTLSSYYRANIIINHDSLKTITLSLTIENLSLDESINTISALLNLKNTFTNNSVILDKPVKKTKKSKK